MSDGALFVVDELRSRQGCAAQLHRAYLRGYAPAARARGMTLLHAWRTPPVELHDGTTTFSFVWAVDGLAGWWRARLGAAADPAVAAWWADARPLIAEHRRLAPEALDADV